MRRMRCCCNSAILFTVFIHVRQLYNKHCKHTCSCGECKWIILLLNSLVCHTNFFFWCRRVCEMLKWLSLVCHTCMQASDSKWHMDIIQLYGNWCWQFSHWPRTAEQLWSKPSKCYSSNNKLRTTMPTHTDIDNTAKFTVALWCYHSFLFLDSCIFYSCVSFTGPIIRQLYS